MNVPNAVHSEHYQQNPNDANDFGFSTKHFNESGKHKMESAFQLDETEKCPSQASGSNLKIQQHEISSYIGYDRCFDSNAIEYRANNSNYSYENLFEANTEFPTTHTQPVAYHTNYGDVNELANETGQFFFHSDIKLFF